MADQGKVERTMSSKVIIVPSLACASILLSHQPHFSRTIEGRHNRGTANSSRIEGVRRASVVTRTNVVSARDDVILLSGIAGRPHAREQELSHAFHMLSGWRGISNYQLNLVARLQET